MDEEVVANTVIVQFALLGEVLLLGMLAGMTFRRLPRDPVAARPEPPAAPTPPPVYGFPVVGVEQPRPAEPIGTGRGRYRVSGVVAATKADVTLYVEADSPANAKVKAELDGVVVTDVSKYS